MPRCPNIPSLVSQKVDPRMLQISLTGFLEKNTSLFVKVNQDIPPLFGFFCAAFEGSLMSVSCGLSPFVLDFYEVDGCFARS